jgi:hypothetical protein
VEIDGSGEIIDVLPTQPGQEKPATSLETLLTQYAADAIMTANGGKIPATQEEIEHAAAVLSSTAAEH